MMQQNDAVKEQEDEGRKGDWTEEELSLLKRACAAYTEPGSISNWASIAQGVPGRSPKQCR